MSYIYKITNIINNKMYIGQTDFCLEKRFKEHCNDALKKDRQHRPLYEAMNKYGFENFKIELIEECQKEDKNSREKFWIEQLRTFKNGYNATYGGSGKPYIDYDLVITTYQETQNIRKVAKIMNISTDSVSNILKLNDVSILSSDKVIRENNLNNRIINMYDLQGNYICSFTSYISAAEYLIKNIDKSISYTAAKGHISQVCKGKRKTAYKHIWKFANN